MLGGELNHRRGQELRDLTNTLRLYAKVERPTVEQLNMIGMTVRLTSGVAIFQKPKPSDLNGKKGFSKSEVVRKMADGNELNSWPNYSGMRVPRDRVGANPVENVGIDGPPMTPAERRIAGATAPKTDDGQRICRNYNSHIGCDDTGCTRAHVFYKNYDALTTAVKIDMVKRYGFEKRNKLSVTKTAETISELRKEAQSEMENRRGHPAARGGHQSQCKPDP